MKLIKIMVEAYRYSTGCDIQHKAEQQATKMGTMKTGLQLAFVIIG